MPKNFDFDAQNEIFPKLGTAAEIARNHTLALFILRGRGVKRNWLQTCKESGKNLFLLLQCLGGVLKFCTKDSEQGFQLWAGQGGPSCPLPSEVEISVFFHVPSPPPSAPLHCWPPAHAWSMPPKIS